MNSKNMLKGFALAMILGIFTVAFSFTSNAQSNNNDNQLIGKSHAAPGLVQHINSFKTNGFSVNATVETTGICFVEGTLKRVHFIAYPDTNKPGMELVRAMPIVIASVDFDCDNNIMGHELY